MRFPNSIPALRRFTQAGIFRAASPDTLLEQKNALYDRVKSRPAAIFSPVKSSMDQISRRNAPDALELLGQNAL
jgi:hypothetical protein